MKTLPTFFLLATLAISAGHAQESPVTGPPPCRFLLIVESSKGMARMASGTAMTVAGLVASGVSGLMQPGDSFALWHFNEEPFQFDFPNQVWQPDQASRRATEARIYIQNLRFDKPVRAELLMREMFIAMRAVDPLTVVLISNGESPMVGTPFDVEINKVYLRRAEELRKARLPFVTTLRCVNRQIEYAAVTAGREEIVLPEPAPKAAAAVAAVAANPSAVSPTKAPPTGGAATTTAPPARPARSSAKTPPRPKPDTTPPASVVARERITNIFPTPLAAPSTSAVVASPTAVALAPRADDGTSAAKIGVPSTNGTLVIAPPALPAPPTLPARAEGPLTLVKIAPPSTNAAAVVAAPIFPLPARTGESPLTLPRISAARTNEAAALLPPPQLPPVVSADPGAAIVQPRVIPPVTVVTGVTAVTAVTGATATAAAIFPRKSAPSFALDNAGGRSAPGAGAVVEGNPPPGKVEAGANTIPPPSSPPAAGPPRLPAAAPVVANSAPTLPARPPAKPLVPERIPEPPKRNAAVTNAGGKVLATAPPLIRPETTTRPIHFLFAGLVLLAVAGWFIVLILRGGRRSSRSSISRAMDE